MEYQLGWTENHPGHIVFLLDLSDSMAENEKIDYLITAAHNAIKDLIQQSAPSGIYIEDNMTLTIIGYNNEVETIVDNKTLSQLLPMLSKKCLLDKKTNAIPRGQTFTAKGMRAATQEIKAWIARQEANSYKIPTPLVVHITDGYPHEGDKTNDSAFTNALNAARELKGIRTPDGHVRLFNFQIEPNMPSYMFPISKPNGTDNADKIMKFLFESASEIDLVTKKYADILLKPGVIKTGSKLMVSNFSDISLITKLLIKHY